MNLIAKLALVIGILGAFATWLFVGPLAAFGLQIWAAFIAWGCFYHNGGGTTGLKQSVFGGLWGAFMATVALILIGQVGGGALGTAVIVGITVAIFIIGANLEPISVIPAAVYGYSALAAFALLKPGADPLALDIVNSPLLNIGVSIIIGGLFGYVSEKIVGMLPE